MCGSKPKAPPPVVQRDPVAEQARAEAQSQQLTNADAAAKRRRQAAGGNGGMANAAIRAATLGSAGSGPSLLAQAKPQG